MGLARSALTRALRFQVQNQHKIDKALEGKPTPAPKHETTKQLLDIAKIENQEKFEQHNRKNNDYLGLLKNIRVNSLDIPDQNVIPKEKTLSVRSGSLTSEQLKVLFEQRMADPQTWDSEKISSHYNLPLDTVENLLKYFSDFHIQEGPKIPKPLAEITY